MNNTSTSQVKPTNAAQAINVVAGSNSNANNAISKPAAGGAASMMVLLSQTQSTATALGNQPTTIAANQTPQTGGGGKLLPKLKGVMTSGVGS